MLELKYFLKRGYDSSRALVIGINQYKNVSPLEYAVSDAEEIKNILINELSFNADDVEYLADGEATKKNILKAFHTFTTEDIKVDDRLVVFFAGHGHTKTGIRGEVGYLVPHDAEMDDYSTFIRWDELTRNAELIRAKHILFVMDACYGGLAVNRDLKSGNSRFLKDMYQRFSRQVITAGKANEVVSDSGGPLPNHSVFTGHLIEGIRGKAKNEYGVITANGLMAYVYNKVANDINSKQTPHYGQFDGDGDFIVLAPNTENLTEEQKKGIDDLIGIPYKEEARTSNSLEEKITFLKELLSMEKSQIRLHDFVVNDVRRFLSDTSEDNFAIDDSFSNQELLDRISSYETYTRDLGAIIAVLAYWSSESDLTVLHKIVSRTSDRLLEVQGGQTVWFYLRWYPLLLLLYYAGIAAVESKNYQSLTAIFYTKLGVFNYGDDEPYFAQKLNNGISELKDADIFKKIPGYEKHWASCSEYLYKQVQPLVEDLFFIGKGYGSAFDEFEVLYALVVVDLRIQSGDSASGPIGRFGWKHKKAGSRNSPFVELVNEASELKENWPPLKAGMFGGSYERYEAAANGFKEILGKLSWY